jgi:hypothetical protein
MPIRTATATRLITYRFSGSIATSSFPGILAGDRLFGRLRYGSPFSGDETIRPGRRFADPMGFVEAIVGAVQLRSGSVQIRVLDGPAMLSLALVTRRSNPGDALISAGAALLVSPPCHVDGAVDFLRSGRFMTRSFTVESAEPAGAATGVLDTLYPLESTAA